MATATERARALDIAEVALTRVIDAPRELVYAAWTDSAKVAAWWGPHGSTNPVCSVDPRPGGSFVVHMRDLDGRLHRGGGSFLELVPGERVSFITRLRDEAGNTLIEAIHDVDLADLGGRTRLELRTRIVTVTSAIRHPLQRVEIALSQSLERLSAILAAI